MLIKAGVEASGIPRTALFIPGRFGAGARLDLRVVGGVDGGINGLFLKDGREKPGGILPSKMNLRV